MRCDALRKENDSADNGFKELILVLQLQKFSITASILSNWLTERERERERERGEYIYIYILVEKKRGREKKREREIYMYLDRVRERGIIYIYI